MTSSEQVREEIARVLHRQATDDGEVHVLWGGADEHDEEVAEWLPFADAILARWPVLAGVSDETVETAARALNPFAWSVRDRYMTDPGAAEVLELDVMVEDSLGQARAVLTAVLGSRDADAPGDGGAT